MLEGKYITVVSCPNEVVVLWQFIILFGLLIVPWELSSQSLAGLGFGNTNWFHDCQMSI